MKCGLLCGLLAAAFFRPSACQAVAPTILATNIPSPGNLIVDDSSVYWVNGNNQLGSISKIPNGGIVINYSAALEPGSGDLAQDDVFLYYMGLTGADGSASICSVPKTGGFASTLSDPTDFFAVGGNDLAVGPVGGILYYNSFDENLPNDIEDIFSDIVSLPTLGGSPTILTYPTAGLAAGGSDGDGDYTGLAALQHDNVNYFPGGSPQSYSVDDADLYWSDGSSIWQMPLVGGLATAEVSGRINIYVIATPTEKAAAGSIFWTEANGSTSRLMRREVGGQIITVLTNIIAAGRCFAVDDTNVFCSQAGSLVQVSINGGAVTVVSPISATFAANDVALDDNYIYCGSLFGSIVRIPRPGVTIDTTPPTVGITSPTANQRLTAPLAHLAGTAGDNVKVAGVFYQFDTNLWAAAGTTNGYTNWNVTLPLPAGTNTAKVYAVDTSGNDSSTSSVSFYSTNAFMNRFSAAPFRTNNGVWLTLNISTGMVCQLQFSTNLVNWSTLTNFTSTHTTMQFLDTSATNYQRRFYQSLVP